MDTTTTTPAPDVERANVDLLIERLKVSLAFHEAQINRNPNGLDTYHSPARRATRDALFHVCDVFGVPMPEGVC